MTHPPPPCTHCHDGQHHPLAPEAPEPFTTAGGRHISLRRQRCTCPCGCTRHLVTVLTTTLDDTEITLILDDFPTTLIPLTRTAPDLPLPRRNPEPIPPGPTSQPPPHDLMQRILDNLHAWQPDP